MLKAIVDLTQVSVGMSMRLIALEARSWLTSFASIPSGYPYRMPPGYGMVAPSPPEALPTTAPFLSTNPISPLTITDSLHGCYINRHLHRHCSVSSITVSVNLIIKLAGYE
ncbi:hypothetical protein GUJ93_ZPchr0002g23134 [Zizania palustris]|uniref:Uncharacterized protein n=1 Tax=Zizania palustris TaxID=103762 RepID=A0A8J5S8H3_ZIZPA|nr:hypothetical protein GUJ93_ZPchr0002g23134 [Zizania palustris]